MISWSWGDTITSGILPMCSPNVLHTLPFHFICLGIPLRTTHDAWTFSPSIP